MSALPPLPTWHGRRDRPSWRDRGRSAARWAARVYGVTLLVVTVAGIVRGLRRGGRPE